MKLRVFAYKVTTSGRSRPHERRVEITTTFRSGLSKSRGYGDVVFGVETSQGKYVGVDNRRLLLGGETHNASSFFDLEGLSVSPGDILVNPRNVAAGLFQGGVEQHAFFDASRISEYLFNHREIHAGSYAYEGLFSGAMSIKKKELPKLVERSIVSGQAFVLRAPKATLRHTRISSSLLKAIESNDFSRIKGRKITPEQLKKMQLAMEEIGIFGEQAVLTHERRRLTKLGHTEAARRVTRVSLKSVGEGYDIISFEDDGVTPRYLEVKATVGDGFVVDVSLGEWKAAKKWRDQYYLVRVLNARTSADLHFFRNPFCLCHDGLISRTPAGWRLDLSGVAK